MTSRTLLPRSYTVHPSVSGSEISPREANIGKVHLFEGFPYVAAQGTFIRPGRITNIQILKSGILIPQLHVPAEYITVNITQDAFRVNFNSVHQSAPYTLFLKSDIIVIYSKTDWFLVGFCSLISSKY
jgi:hypothetical protein